MITVSIVDDEKKFCKLIATFINNSPGFRCVSTYHSAEDALEHLPKDRIDVVLMDIRLKGMSGIECVAQLKPMVPQTQIIMLTGCPDTDQIFKALSVGAKGYMLKPLTPPELLQAIREVFEGGSPMSGPIARKVVASFQVGGQASKEQTILSSREKMVLDCFAKGLTYKQASDQLSISIHTIRTYVRRIYDKLHVQSRTEAVAKSSANLKFHFPDGKCSL
jgi:DNA-binding NarL/FixJ family response regulator